MYLTPILRNILNTITSATVKHFYNNAYFEQTLYREQQKNIVMESVFQILFLKDFENERRAEF